MILSKIHICDHCGWSNVYYDAHLIMIAIVHIDPMSIMKLITMQNYYICGKNGWKIVLQNLLSSNIL